MTGLFSEYIVSVMSMGICVYICEWLCIGKGTSQGMKKTVSFICGMCLFITVALPFISAVKSFAHDSAVTAKTFAQPKQSGQTEDLYELTAKEMSERLSEMIFLDTGINPELVSIQLREENDMLCVGNVTVSVCDRQDEKVISDYLAEKGFDRNIVTVKESAS